MEKKVSRLDESIIQAKQAYTDAKRKVSAPLDSRLARYALLHRLWRQNKLSDEHIKDEIDIAISELTHEIIRLKEFRDGVLYFEAIEREKKAYG